jgi:ParB-like chromosome segregation protein Spo0J
MKTILAQIVEVDDLQARRITAAENLQREDLSAIDFGNLKLTHL